jgi:RND family efflux transporter MFP subunit
MNWANFRKVVRYLHAVAGPPSAAGPTDGQLLDRYVSQRDEAAFELLLWRHGTMVLNVCRRILREDHDAEDAFQATFLAFVRKARSIVQREAVAGWLYRVAYRVALEAREKARKTAERERHGTQKLEVEEAPESGWQELRPLLDEEMNRLPERLRLPLVLCYLEGKTNEEAARQLGCPPGTIFSRLARGREMLRRRLIRRGFVFTAGGLGTLLAENAASAVVSSLLVGPTLKAAQAFGANQIAAGAASTRVIALAEGVLKAMYLSKLKTIAALVLVLAVLLTGGILSRRALEAAPQQEADQNKWAKPDDAPKPGPQAKQGPIAVQVTTPKPGGLERMTTQNGTVRAAGEARIFASVSGTLKSLTVDIGDRVKRGQVLGEIDAPLVELELKQAQVAVKQSKALAQEAQARVQQARAEIEVAKSAAQEKEAVLDSYQKQYLLVRTRHQAGKATNDDVVAAARGQITLAEATLINAKADIKVKESKAAQAEASLEMARAGLESAELSVEKARQSLSLTRIAAPFDGVVTQRNYFAGDTVRTGEQGGREPILTLMQMDSVRVVVSVPDSDVPLTEVGLPVDLQIDALRHERFTGLKVARIGVSEDENRRMRVEMDVPNPKGILRPGMFARATIHLAKGSPNALRIPAASVFQHDGKDNVYVVRDNQAHRVAIELRWTLGNEVNSDELEVLSGLKPSDRVVVNPKGLNGEVVPVQVKKEGVDR